MRQGNIFWYTDTLAIEGSDLPSEYTLEYPQIRVEDIKIIDSMMELAGIKYSKLPVKVWNVNDN